MNIPKSFDLDRSGKVKLDDIYDNPDPRTYFSTLGRLDYQIPQQAKPAFAKLIHGYRTLRGRNRVRVVDIGCSYGVNAALLKADLDMADLYRLYGSEAARALKTGAMMDRDRAIYGDGETGAALEFVGIDAAPRALAYADAVGLVDSTIAANLEREPLSERDRIRLSGADIVISTGCIGYVTERTLEKILDAAAPRRPWMAHFVLRMFPFAPIQEMLTAHGYVTAHDGGHYRQRRFASGEERAEICRRLVEQGIDPSGLEADGWLYADLYVSRPAEDMRELPAERLLLN